MSLACLHQAIRQRTWNHTLESIYDAVGKAIAREKETRMVIPPSIRGSELNLMYQKQHQDMLNLYEELLKGGIPAAEAIGVIPHSVKIYTLIHINGWNAIHSFGIRLCLTAQWEIRRITLQMARRIEEELPALGKWVKKPQCLYYQKCPEEKKDCSFYKRLKI